LQRLCPLRVVDGGHVYVGGDTMDCTADDAVATASVWKDGVRTDLPKPQGAAGSSAALQIVVKSGSVYAVGFATDANAATLPVFWKDGLVNVLPMPEGAEEGVAYNIAINGADVYVSGVVEFDDYYPVLWKNGVAQVLPRSYEFRSDEAPLPITVVGNDVYVFGTVQHIPSTQVNSSPRLAGWLNGEFSMLYPVESAESGIAYDGAMINGVAYRAGVYFEGTLYTPSLWVNNTRQRLSMPDEDLFGIAKDLFVDSGVVYVAGANFVEDPDDPSLVIEKPCYWAGGARVDLPTLAPGAAFAYDIFVGR
jgi:hypothetical protein